LRSGADDAGPAKAASEAEVAKGDRLWSAQFRSRSFAGDSADSHHRNHLNIEVRSLPPSPLRRIWRHGAAPGAAMCARYGHRANCPRLLMTDLLPCRT